MTRRTAGTGMLATLLAGCGPTAATDPPKKEEPVPPPRDAFAADRAPAAAPFAFDGEKAMAHLKELCDIGPRVSGSAGMAKQQDLAAKHFTAHGGKVVRQEFVAKVRGGDVPMANLVVSFHPDRPRRVLLCTHYDTRPAAHEEPNRADWARPFVSANDGTAGVALLMEFARHVKDLPLSVGLDFCLFDGEEYITRPDAAHGAPGNTYFLGSTHFATEYAKDRGRKHEYVAAVLFDMCSAPGARLAVEGYSLQFAPKLVDQIWGVALKRGAKSFKYERGFNRAIDVMDDHLPLNQAGIPAVDIIDFDYPHWHKLTDTPDKCSAAQTAEVAGVIAAWLATVK